MNQISIKAVLKKTENGKGFFLIPATQTDLSLASCFTAEVENSYLTVTIKNAKANKTYKQLQTAWALITILFESTYGRKPTETERQEFHTELLELYSDKKQSSLHPDKSVPVTLREMSNQQISKFIQCLITELGESCDLSFDEQVEIQKVFFEWQNYMGEQEQDWNDYDENGNLLPMDYWKSIHTVSFASGKGGALDVAHIVTRGSDTADIDHCWNVMMLTREEHLKQHEIGWVNFCEIYPHLKGRVERAKKLAGHISLAQEKEIIEQSNLYKRK